MDDYRSDLGCETSHPLLHTQSNRWNRTGRSNGRPPFDKSWIRKRFNKRGAAYIFLLILICIFIVIYYWWELDSSLRIVPIEQIISKPTNMVTFNELIQENFEFDIKGSDVMVFLHMQKTGGTAFGKHLVEDLELERECECSKGSILGKKKKKLRCNCFRPGKGKKHWLFSRYSTGWKCGLHPDWTELTSCVDHYLQGLEGNEASRRYFYITFLREPTARFISEFKHVQRGATWKTSTYMCGGISWYKKLPKCYEGEDWSYVDLESFISCKHNFAVNRQTRMLADLELVNCYNSSRMSPETRDRILLSSAKANLEKMAYFGVTEEQRTSQYLFEATFNLRFNTILGQFNNTHSEDAAESLTKETLNRIRNLNSLDHELYTFALQLMEKRFLTMQGLDPGYREHMIRLKTAPSNTDIEPEDY
ncbi:heparan-sulfate 6-O-sulfotransferase 2 [Eurytemora carolleeae]|uniref:heparan-sulfate 6-O-sulfotransferase 2 n=1 Tax=Eurytemora carolleeae TaxID=1294199 RepID=UPI000C7586D3|nr:heparan-sulfate 6-O-sulfotransferase 2 [Eurytemora carolleeae]|eukprot:XP_023322718.1 heparan-sulfate 6-O-sulfotransferase 2-like [Eurytemora affinis]